MSTPIVIPNGATVIDVSSFDISTYSHNDTPVERVVLDVNGHDVQIIRHNSDDTDVYVYVDEHLVQTNMDNVNPYINSHTK